MKKNNGFSIVLIISLAVQAVMIILALMYAFFGEYERNRPSNVWAAIGARGLLVAMLFGGAAFIIMGIIGLCTSKGNKRQAVLSGVLLGSLLPGVVSFGLAIGSHF